jgi:hypothetical protein
MLVQQRRATNVSDESDSTGLSHRCPKYSDLSNPAKNTISLDHIRSSAEVARRLLRAMQNFQPQVVPDAGCLMKRRLDSSLKKKEHLLNIN